MQNDRLIILGLVFVFLVGTVNAVPERIHMNLDYNQTDQTGNYTPTNDDVLFDNAVFKVGLGSASVNGNDHIDTTYEPNWMAADKRSISFWFKGSKHNSYFVGSSVLGAAAFQARTHNTAYKGDYMYYDENHAGYEQINTIDVGTGNWNHLTWIDNGTHMQFYINGTLDSTKSTGYVQDFSGFSFLLFGYSYSGGVAEYGSNAWIDDFRMYDLALDSSQIDFIYNNSYGTPLSLTALTPPIPDAPVVDFLNISHFGVNYFDQETYLNMSCSGTTATFDIGWDLYTGSTYNSTFSGTNTINNNTMTIIETINANSFSNQELNFTAWCSDGSSNTSGSIQKTILPEYPQYTSLNYIGGLTNATINLTTNDEVNLTYTVEAVEYFVPTFNFSKQETLTGLDKHTIYYFTLNICNVRGKCSLNTSTPIQTKTELVFSPFEILTGNPLASFTGTLNITYNETYFESQTKSTTTGNISFVVGYPNLFGNFQIEGNLTSSITGYINTNVSYLDFQATDENLLQADFWKTVLNVTAQNGDAVSINDFTITLRTIGYLNQEIGSTTNGWVAFNVINGTHNLSAEANGYADLSRNKTTIGAAYDNYLFTLLQGGWGNFFFNHELTGSLIDNQTVVLEVISTTFANNYSTTNGTLGFNLTPEEYTFRYYSTGFQERFYYASILSDANYTFNLYLVPTYEVSNITVTVLDQNNNRLEDFTVKLLKYDLATNSYILVDMEQTNVDGEARVLGELYSEFYKFLVVDNDGNIKKETSPSYITDTSITIQVVVGGGGTEEYHYSHDISSSLNFNDLTNNFKWTYSDKNNIIHSACLDIFKLSANNGTILLNSTCLSSVSGTILVGVQNISGSRYKADAFVYFNDLEYFIDSKTQSFSLNAPFGTKEGAIYTFILGTLAALTGFLSLTVAVILVPLVILIASLIGFIELEIGIALGLFILGIIVAVLLERRK